MSMLSTSDCQNEVMKMQGQNGAQWNVDSAFMRDPGMTIFCFRGTPQGNNPNAKACFGYYSNAAFIGIL